MTAGVASRLAAASTVGRVVRDGAYSNVVLEHETSELSSEEAAHARRLAYDALRLLTWVEPAIAEAAGRPLTSIESPVADLLRVCGAELAGGQAPPRAVVHTGVEAIRRLGRPRAAGFVNAVLRRLGERPPGPAGDELWSVHAMPEWLGRSLVDAWGEAEADAFFSASNRPAARSGRLRPGAPAPPGGSPFPAVPSAFLLGDGPIPPGVVVQDPASVAVGLAVNAAPGSVVADLAAAPGGKTLHLVDQVGATGLVVALDRHERRTRDAARRVPDARWVAGDATRPPFCPASFDRVLLDAPCSGLGTLRRRPEIRHRATADGVRRLAVLQRSMIEAAIPLLRSGGLLVYSVCTITPEETVDTIAGLGFEPPAGLPGRRWGDGILLGPHLGGTDGMFVAQLQG
ncbi:MAG: RsmB/NOP family class I SAM-dependent RNA methyltransferase [Acidimicrobiia bacterium]|jgi:16S rRNA (cytosine967-C5)-methyltransferase